jgi:hypothetical protein
MTAERDAAWVANKARAYARIAKNNAVLRAFGQVDAGTREGLLAMAKVNKISVNRLLAILLIQGRRHGV